MPGTVKALDRNRNNRRCPSPHRTYTLMRKTHWSKNEVSLRVITVIIETTYDDGLKMRH